MSVSCSHQLHNIIAYKLQSIADLLIEFGIDNPINQRVERQRIDDNKTLHTNRVKYNKSHLNTTLQPSVFEYALNDPANLMDFMSKVKSNNKTTTNGDLINEEEDNNETNSSNSSSNSSSNNVQQSDPQTFSSFNYKPNRKKLITVDSLIIGALESGK